MTSDGEALFRAVCDNPADDTPRLVYADWLEENGRGERAEFIRLQCEASHRSPAHPTDEGRRTRASRLLAQFGHQWYDELPALSGVEWGALFVRGFVDAVLVRYAKDMPDTLVRVFTAAPLQFLSVSSVQPGQLRELLAWPLLGRLVRLRLPGTRGREEARMLTEARERFPTTEFE